MQDPKRCEICEKVIPLARLIAIPETTLCVKCSEKHGPKKKVGFMVSNCSKGTASTLIAIDPDDKEAIRQARRAHNRER